MSRSPGWRPRRSRGRRTTLAAEQRRLRLALTSFAVVVLVGFVGYQVVEQLSPLDSLYMTVITITTVGFREVVELGTDGKILTILLIVAGIGSVSYTAFSGAEFIVEGHLRDYLERRRMDRSIGRLDRHIIVAGFGRVGRHLANTLARDGEAFVVVDEDEEKVKEGDDLGYLTVRGDATEEHVLLEAGLERARAIVACVNYDADNVLVTITAKGLRPDCVVIARVKADENERKLHRAGADRVISPSTIGGRRIAQILTRPAVADFIDGIAGGAVDYTLEEVPVIGRDLVGLTLRDARIRERFQCTVVALRHTGDQTLDSHPDPTYELQEGDTLVVMGAEDDVTTMRDYFTGA